MDEMKAGRLVGQDKYGNKYFEDPSQFYGRNRWVEYAPHFNLEYDGSQIPAEWFGWMHYKVNALIELYIVRFVINRIIVADRFATESRWIASTLLVDGRPQREPFRNKGYVRWSVKSYSR